MGIGHACAFARVPADHRPSEIIRGGAEYLVVGVLSSGGRESDVYDVEHIRLEKRFVLKAVKRKYAADRDLCNRFVRHAQLHARIDGHPNIVRVLDVGDIGESSVPYCILERLNGDTARSELVRHGRIDPRVALSVGVDVLEGLGHAHRHGIVHRDIKVENIFLHYPLRGPRVTKLIDWNTLLSADERRGGEGFVGTLRNAPPEQIQQPSLVTPQSDLWSAGVAIFLMLTGQHPVAKGCRTDEEIVHAVMNREPLRLRNYMDAPPALDRFLGLMLSKDPAERPADAFALATALRRVIDVFYDAPRAYDLNSSTTVEEAIPSERGAYPWQGPPTASPDAHAPVEMATEVDPPARISVPLDGARLDGAEDTLRVTVPVMKTTQVDTSETKAPSDPKKPD